jgi:hypothetical protein
MTKQIFPFYFLLQERAKPILPPFTPPSSSAHELKPSPPPSPSTLSLRPKDFVLIKPLVLMECAITSSFKIGRRTLIHLG